jgi:hypothetical protein
LLIAVKRLLGIAQFGTKFDRGVAAAFPAGCEGGPYFTFGHAKQRIEPRQGSAADSRQRKNLAAPVFGRCRMEDNGIPRETFSRDGV